MFLTHLVPINSFPFNSRTASSALWEQSEHERKSRKRITYSACVKLNKSEVFFWTLRNSYWERLKNFGMSILTTHHTDFNNFPKLFEVTCYIILISFRTKVWWKYVSDEAPKNISRMGFKRTSKVETASHVEVDGRWERKALVTRLVFNFPDSHDRLVIKVNRHKYEY